MTVNLTSEQQALLQQYAYASRNFSDYIYDPSGLQSKIPAGWTKLIEPLDNKKTGAYIEAWQSPDNTAVMFVSRGTELNDPKDINNDTQMLCGKVPMQMDDLVSFHDQLNNQGLLDGKQLIFTGNSAAGSVSEAGAALFGGSALTYNSYGVQPWIQDAAIKYNKPSISDNPSDYSNRIINFNIDSDMVGNVGTHLGENLYLPNPINSTLEGAIDVLRNLGPMSLNSFVADGVYHVYFGHLMDNFYGFDLENPNNDNRISQNPGAVADFFNTFGEALRKVLSGKDTSSTTIFFGGTGNLPVFDIGDGTNNYTFDNLGVKITTPINNSQDIATQASPFTLFGNVSIDVTDQNGEVINTYTVKTGENIPDAATKFGSGVNLVLEGSDGKLVIPKSDITSSTSNKQMNQVNQNITHLTGKTGPGSNNPHFPNSTPLVSSPSAVTPHIASTVLDSYDLGRINASNLSDLLEPSNLDALIRDVNVYDNSGGTGEFGEIGDLSNLLRGRVVEINDQYDQYNDMFQYDDVFFNDDIFSYEDMFSYDDMFFYDDVFQYEDMFYFDSYMDWYNPLAIDLDGDGVETIPFEKSNVYFDMDNDSYIERTSWLGKDDGLLVVDKNDNGQIDNINEMFGSPDVYGNGFEELGAFDTIIKDGIISSEEIQAGKIKIWQDVNENGITETGELKDIETLGITAINLGYKNTYVENNGNYLESVSSFVKSNGSYGLIADAFFAATPSYTKANEDYVIDSNVVNLPWIRGYGEVSDLPLRMTENPNLKNLVEQITQETTINGIYSRIDELLSVWTDTSLDDDFKTNVVKKFTSRDFSDKIIDDGSDNDNTFIVEEAFQTIKNKIFVDFLAQTQLGTDLGITYDFSIDTISVNENTLYNNLVNNLQNENLYSSSLIISKFLYNEGLLNNEKLNSVTEGNGYGNILTEYSASKYTNYIYGNSSNNSINGIAYSDFILGFDGNDSINQGAGQDFIYAGKGNDTITNTSNDILTDTLADDVYFFSKGDGQDVITDAGGNDLIVFDKGIDEGDLDFSKSSNNLDLIISNKTNTDKITIKNWYTSDNNKIEKFVYANGYLSSQIFVSDINGDSGNNTLTGNKENNVYKGNGGNDRIKDLKGGSDKYIFNRGDGQDVIEDYDTVKMPNPFYMGSSNINEAIDRIKFGQNITRGDLEFVKDKNNLIVKIKYTTDQITIKNWFKSYNESLLVMSADKKSYGLGTITLYKNQIEVFEFDNGDYISRDDIQISEITNSVDNTYTLKSAKKPISDDSGDETYIVNASWGQDTITDSQGKDILRFSSEINKDDISFTRLKNNLVLKQNGTDNNITIKNWYSSSVNRIESFEFADGTALNNEGIINKPFSILGTDNADSLVGYAGNDSIMGYKQNDTIFDFGGDDTINAGIGNDQIFDYVGNDTYIFNVGDKQDIIQDSAGTDVLKIADIKSNFDFIRDGYNLTLVRRNSTDKIIIKDWYKDDNLQIERIEFSDGSVVLSQDIVQELDTIYGTSEEDTINGVYNDDLLIGSSGNNIIDGKAGSDVMIGGDGNDTYYADDLNDFVIEGISSGVDTINSNVTGYILPDNVENLTLITGTSAITGTGNSQNNYLTGNALNNVLYGLAGDDTLDGGSGSDTLYGGEGNDTYTYASVDTFIENPDGGIDTLNSSVSYTIASGSNIENLTLTGTGTINGIGNEFANYLYGNSVSNTLTGGLGDDTLDGGTGGTDSLVGGEGNDTYIFNYNIDTVNDTAGNDTVVSGIASYTLATNIETLVLTGSNNINGTGNTSNNTIIGNDGNNVIDGGAGIDSMVGGLGDDSYIIDSLSDIILENPDGGSDIVSLALPDYTLLNNFEKLTLTGSGAINGSGNSADNYLAGNAGANRLYGLTGNDTLDGGSGNDTLLGGDGNDSLFGGAGTDSMVGETGDDIYTVDTTSDIFVEYSGEGNDTIQTSVTYTLGSGSNIENLTLLGSSTIKGTGNEFNNYLYGNSGNNTLTGGLGDDTLNGGTGGTDSLVGGEGDDTYILDYNIDPIYEIVGAGTDTVLSCIAAYTLANNVETLILTGIGNINGTGNASDNTIIGNDGNNVINGGAGSDSMVGGLGDDSYTIDSLSDIILENPDEGSDIVSSALPDYTLLNNFERLTLTGSGAINGSGNSEDNYLTGNTGANRLYGLTGNDTLDGGSGNDTLLGGNGNDSLFGGAGTDSMVGGIGDDIYAVDAAGDIITELTNEGFDTVKTTATYTLGSQSYIERLELAGSSTIKGTGNDFANYLYGNSGNNTLTGGLGDDTLDGGTGGTDSLVGGSDNDTYILNYNVDSIYEVAGAGNDTIISSIAAYTLANNVETLILTGIGNINGTGNASDNTIIGNNGNNVINGGAGSDSMVGGLGNDTYVVDNSSDSINESINAGIDIVNSTASDYTLSDNLEKLTLTGSGAINGSGNSEDNYLTGNTGANRLYGLDGDDTLDGGDGIDTLIGGVGNDSISGGTGTDADSMVGGIGDDVYTVDAAGDVIIELNNEGFDTIKTSVTYTLGSESNVERLELTGSSTIKGTGNDFANYLYGNSGNNTLTGGLGDDTLDGGTGGTDSLVGGEGNDTYILDYNSDLIYEVAGNDTVLSKLNYTLGTNIENLTLTGVNTIGVGNASNNAIIGNTYSNNLSGLDGNDHIYSDAGDDTLVGGNGNDTLIGGEGNDSLDGGAGADSMTGGTEDDTYIVDNSNDVIIESTDQGNDTVITSVAYNLPDNVENIIYMGVQAGSGNDLDNSIKENSGACIIYGNGGNDTLDGSTVANDTLCGGTGDDTYIINLSTNLISENSGEGIDTVLSGVTYTLGNNVENLTLSGTGNTAGIGNSLDNTITGNSGTNALTGGDGNDTYIIQNATDVITENTIAGNDTIMSSVSYTLGNNIENLILTGTSNITGTGNSLDNIITGNDGINTLIGGTGNDTYIIQNTADVITENTIAGNDTIMSSVSYTLGNNIENLTLTGVDSINGTGNSFDNVLTGNTEDNVIDGGLGNDTIIAGYGNDTVTGGDGNDTYVLNPGDNEDIIFDSTGTDKIIFGGEILPRDLVFSKNWNDLVINFNNSQDKITIQSWFNNYKIESLEFFDESSISADSIEANIVEITGTSGNDSIIANGLNNVIYDYLGNDTIYGVDGNDNINDYDGNDYIYGDAGNDYIYSFNSGNDFINGGSGNDFVVDYQGSDTIYGGDGNDYINDYDGNDYIYGNVGNDTINSFNAGADFIDGGSGSDGIYEYAGNDTVYSGDDSDTINDYEGNDSLNSGAGDDLINSYNIGDDTLIGSTGNDTIVDSGGNDTYIFNAGDSNDVIFDASGTDKILFGAGIAPPNAIFSSNWNDLVVNFSNSSDQITIQSWFDNCKIETLQFYDGSSINADNIEASIIEITGTSGNDTITGNALSNLINDYEGFDIIYGGDGNDTIKDYAGDDQLYGDAGNDLIYSYNAGNDTIDAGTGNDTVHDYDGNNLLTGGTGNDLLCTYAGNDTLYGNDGNDTLNAYNSGDDLLDGGTGADTMLGALGNDIYYLDNTSDAVWENLNEGTDEVRSAISYALWSNVEKLTLIGSANINGEGNDLNNTITGNLGNNYIVDYSGSEYIDGGLGNDTIGDYNGNDYLFGNDGNDSICSYNAGNDTLTGGVGNDTINDYVGNDLYIFNSGDQIDVIYDETGTDEIDFGSNVLKNNIAFFRNNSDGSLIVDYKDLPNNDQIRILYENAHRIEKFKLDNGQFLTDTNINNIINYITNYATQHSITISSVNDVKSNLDLMTYISGQWHT